MRIRIESKGHLNSRVSLCRFRKLHLAALIVLTCLAGGTSSAATSRLYPPGKDQAGTLRLAQVMELATRDEILKLGVSLQSLLASGVKESDLKDGSLAMGRVYCCHQSTDQGTAMWFYVPPDVTVQVGDIVEIRIGRESTKTDPGAVNAVTQVREKQGSSDSKCSWDPPKSNLWRRILYCTWMPAEGWTLTKGSHNTWLKPASGAKTP
jgi:hypothetical protein